MIKNSIILIYLFLLSGCAYITKIEPVISKGQSQVFHEGIKTLISNKNSVVAVRTVSEAYNPYEKFTLIVFVYNGTSEQYDFGPENIDVSQGGKPLKVFSYEELVQEIKNQQGMQSLSAALLGASQLINSSNAGYTTYSGTFSGDLNGIYSGYSYNNYAVMQAQALANAQTQANLERINFETCLALDRLSSTILKKETLFTESSIGGYVKIENLPTPKESNVICVKIETGSEKHEFIFNHDSIRNKK